MSLYGAKTTFPNPLDALLQVMILLTEVDYLKAQVMRNEREERDETFNVIKRYYVCVCVWRWMCVAWKRSLPIPGWLHCKGCD